MRLEGKSALVTGGGRRLGAGICEALAAEGARVAIHYRTSGAGAEGVRGRCPGSRCFAADLSKSPERERLLREVTASMGPIHILVNSASHYEETPLEAVDEAAWERAMTVNLKAPFFLSRDAGLAMKRGGGGVIVNLTDWAIERPYADRLPYFAAKAGLEAMTRGLARALAPEVRVNAVAPGAMLAPPGPETEMAEKMAAATLLGRLGGMQPIAEAVLFLICNNFITGQVLTVDGGRSLR